LPPRVLSVSDMRPHHPTPPVARALVIVSAALLCTSCGGSSTSYASGFRPAYLPVVTRLNRVTPACAYATQVGQLPACGRRVAAFRAAVARLRHFVTQTSPPAKAQVANRQLIASLRIMQARFTTLAALIEKKDIGRFRAMGGPGKPIDNSIQSFVAAVGAIDAQLPGNNLPLPG
jgi:hypothetical protein